MKNVERQLNNVVSNKNFDSKYHKNIIIDIAHYESIVANTKKCSVCGKGKTKKEQKLNSRYGYQFGIFYNKRHKHNRSGQLFQVYFTDYICGECIVNIENKLNYKFVKSYAP